MQIKKAAAGISLIEVLIALSLLAVLASGLAILHGATRQAARQTVISADAFALAAELADLIRSTTQPLTPDALKNAFASLEVTQSSAVTSCFRQDCTPQQVVIFDLSQWHQRILRLVPAARVKVCRAQPAAAWRWDCEDDATLTMPLMIRIGWPLPLAAREFPPSIALAVGAMAR